MNSKFKKGFEKLAISLGFIDRLSNSGTMKRVARLREKAPETLAAWAGKSVPEALEKVKRISADVKKIVPQSDLEKFVSPYRADIHYKDLHKNTRDYMRVLAKTVTPPKVK